MTILVQKFRSQSPKLLSQDLLVESSSQRQELGTIWQLSDGRKFVYAKNGAVALTAGKLLQQAAPAANHLNIAVASAVAVGAVAITVTLGATAVTANEYAEGFLHINDVDGEGNLYKIKSHSAADASASLVVNLYDSIRVALTTSSQVTLTKHPYKDVIICPTTLTGAPVGASLMAVTANYYFWAQVAGAGVVLVNGTIVIGNIVVAGATTAGSVDAAATTDILGIVGRVLQVNASTEYALVQLSI